MNLHTSKKQLPYLFLFFSFVLIGACCEPSKVEPSKKTITTNKTSPIKEYPSGTTIPDQSDDVVKSSDKTIKKKTITPPLEEKASLLQADIKQSRQENEALKRKVEELTKKAIEQQKLLEKK